MATRQIIEKYDDIDETVGEDVETYCFTSPTGIEYEIDLNTANVERLQQALEPFVAVARVLRKQRTKRKSMHFSPSAHGTTPGDIRAWAFANGLEVSERGAIPGWLGEAWLKREISPNPARGGRRGAVKTAS